MQSLDRFVLVLKALAMARNRRLKLSEVAKAIGLTPPTTLRLLDALVRQGLVAADSTSKTFGLGRELFFLGLAASRSVEIAPLARPALEKLAVVTGDAAYLSLRSGTRSVCVARVHGSYPVQTLTIEVGDSRPLGVGAGSLALLAALPDDEIEEILLANRTDIAAFEGVDATRLRTDIAQTRRDSFTYTRGHIVPDVHALARAVRDPFGNVVAAITVAAISSRFADDRFKTTLTAVEQAAREVERALLANSKD